MTQLITHIIGTGSYLPEKCLSNHDLSQIVETSDSWIKARTGIETRHIAAEGEVTSDLATEAARRALDAAGLTADDIDLILVATTTPDKTFPATAAYVQAKLGVTKGAAFDIQAVCSGFVFGLATADSLLKQGLFKTALVIGAETFSRILDWTDRATCVLFGDGSGAVVLQACDGDKSAKEARGILAHHIRTDGEKADLLYVDGGVSSTQTIGHVHMNGPKVFKYAVMNISSAVMEVLRQADLTIEDIDWFVPHQANQRILDGVAKKLGINESKVVSTVSRHANTSAASIPLALDTAIRDGRIKSGQLILIEAMGGGFTWGASLFRI